MAAYAYDGTNLLIEAIRSAGLNRVLIRDRLFERDRVEGVTGEIVFDPTFNNITPVRIAVVRDGRIEIERP